MAAGLSIDSKDVYCSIGDGAKADLEESKDGFKKVLPISPDDDDSDLEEIADELRSPPNFYKVTYDASYEIFRARYNAEPVETHLFSEGLEVQIGGKKYYFPQRFINSRLEMIQMLSHLQKQKGFFPPGAFISILAKIADRTQELDLTDPVIQLVISVCGNAFNDVSTQKYSRLSVERLTDLSLTFFRDAVHLIDRGFVRQREEFLSEVLTNISQLVTVTHERDHNGSDVVTRSVAPVFRLGRVKAHTGPLAHLTRENVKRAPVFERITFTEASLIAIRAKRVAVDTENDPSSPAVISALISLDKTHPVMHKENWYDYALAAYFLGKITDSQLLSLALIASAESNPYPHSTRSIQTKDGKEIVANAISPYFVVEGTTKEETAEMLQFVARDLSPVESQVIVVDFDSEDPECLEMQIYNTLEYRSFFITGADGTPKMVMLTPSLLERLLQLTTGDNHMRVNATFGYSKNPKYWMRDPISRDATIVMPGIYTPVVHDFNFSHPHAVTFHDLSYHLLIESNIPLKHRRAFRRIAQMVTRRIDLMREADMDPADIQQAIFLRSVICDRDFALYTRKDTTEYYFGDEELSDSEKFFASIMLLSLKISHGHLIEHHGLSIIDDFEFSEGDRANINAMFRGIMGYIMSERATFEGEFGLDFGAIDTLEGKLSREDPRIYGMIKDIYDRMKSAMRA